MTMTRKYNHNALALAVLASITAVGQPAVAQPADFPVLEEVIVTAQKREESIQDVPFTVNALGGESMNDLQVTNFEDLQVLTPGMDMRNIDGRAGSIALRGVDFNPNSAAAQAVDVYWNGATLGANATGGVFQEMFDIGRVEILRGPQGTLQGRTSPAGAVAIHTRKPVMDEFEGYVRTTFTDNSGNNTQVAASIPLIDQTLSARVAAVYNDTEMNEVDNVLGGPTTNTNTTGGRLSLTWYPTDTLSADLAYQYLDNSLESHQVLKGASALGQDLPTLRAKDKLGINPQTDEFDGRFENLALTLNWELGGHDITYVGGYSEVASYRDFDNASGNSEVGFEPVGLTDEYPQIGVRGSMLNSPQAMDDQNYASSHEVRVSSLDNEFWNYTLGVYYGTESGHFDRYVMRSIPIGGGNAVFFGNVANTPFSQEDLGVFMHNRWDFDNNWSAQFGLRWQENKRNVRTDVYSSEDATIPGATIPEGTLLLSLVDDEDQRQTWDKVTGNATVQYAFDAEDVISYLTAGTSYRPGGTTVTNRNIGEYAMFNEEESWFVELGFKSKLLDNRLRLNGAVFYQDYDDYIGRVSRVAINNGGIPRPDGGPTHETSITTNGDAEVTGVELDFEYMLSTNWVMGGGISYVDAEYKDGVQIPCNTDENIPPGEILNTCDYSGQELGSQPKDSASLHSEYTIPLESMETYARGLYRFTGNRSEPDTDSGRLGSYATFDLHLGLRDMGARWDVSLFARNLFDREATITLQPEFRDFNGVGTGYQRADILQQRLVGISATYNF
jgi:iron complex outermembrane recepter protein